MPTSPEVIEALKNSRLGRLKYTDWSNPTNIKNLLDSCSKTKSISRVGISPHQINSLERSLLASTEETIGPKKDPFDFVFSEDIVPPNIDKTIQIALAESVKYENELILFKLDVDRRLREVREKRLSLLKKQYEGHFDAASPGRSRILVEYEERLQPLYNSEILQASSEVDDDDNYSTKEVVETVQSEQRKNDSFFGESSFSQNSEDASVGSLNNEVSFEPYLLNEESTADKKDDLETVIFKYKNNDEVGSTPIVQEVKNRLKHFKVVDNEIRSKVEDVEEVEFREMILKKLDTYNKLISEDPGSFDKSLTKAEILLDCVNRSINASLSKIFSLTPRTSPVTPATTPKSIDRRKSSEKEQPRISPITENAEAKADVFLEKGNVQEQPQEEPTLQNEPISRAEMTPSGAALLSYLQNQLEESDNYLHSFDNETDRAKKAKAVNLQRGLISMINMVSQGNFKQTVSKIRQLLKGDVLVHQGNELRVGYHPKAQQFCFRLIAKQLVKQAPAQETLTAVMILARIAVTLGAEFPDIVKYLIGELFLKCPYLVPAYFDKPEDKTDEEYLQLLGFNKNEKLPLFIKRMKALAKFFGVLTIASPENLASGGGFRLHPNTAAQTPSPFGLSMAWHFLVSVGNLEPQQHLTIVVLSEVLQIVGAAMKQEYGIQFDRLIEYFRDVYVKKLAAVEMEGQVSSFRDIVRPNFRFQDPRQG